MSNLVFILLFLVSCSTIVQKAKVGYCLRHKWESGEWKVVKNDGENLTIEEMVPGKMLGQIKEVGQHYGGWKKVSCSAKQGEKW